MGDLESTRRQYADQIRDVLWRRHRLRLSDELRSAFARVRREDFLEAAPWIIRGTATTNFWRQMANRLRRRPPARDWTTDDPTRLYHPDLVVAIDARRGLNNGQPSGLALWLHFLELQPGNHVLHVGCGLGYYTAVIATVVGPTGRVVAVEVDAALATRARANLSAFGWVEVVEGDGGEYDPRPVDAILVNAGVTHPRAVWLERLRPGGRAMLPVTDDTGTGMMLRITREQAGYSARWISSLTIFACVGGRSPELGRRLRADFARGDWRSVKSLPRDSHDACADCWFHADEFCLSTRAVANIPLAAERQGR
jgi:protein-L-isoaspartate(D-aspartate) O-methyltransferase